MRNGSTEGHVTCPVCEGGGSAWIHRELPHEKVEDYLANVRQPFVNGELGALSWCRFCDGKGEVEDWRSVEFSILESNLAQPVRL